MRSGSNSKRLPGAMGSNASDNREDHVTFTSREPAALTLLHAGSRKRHSMLGATCRRPAVPARAVAIASFVGGGQAFGIGSWLVWRRRGASDGYGFGAHHAPLSPNIVARHWSRVLKPQL